LFGIPLSTHRDRSIVHGPFPYELWIAAISIAFFRSTIHAKDDYSRWVFAGVLGYMAYHSMPYEYIVGMELFSYIVPLVMNYKGEQSKKPPAIEQKMAFLGGCGALCWSVCHCAASGALLHWMGLILPSFVKNGLLALFPVEEIKAAYNIVDQFIWEEGLLQHQVSILFFITFHIQCGIGYLGIDFLKAEQARRNQLVRMDLQDDGKKKKEKKHSEAMMTKSRNFQKSAAPFIFFVALPYMIKIITFGNLNAFAFACFNNDVHRAIRLHDLFDHENNLVALASHSAKSPADYADYMSVVVSTTYDLFNRKLFSLPKLMLLPMIMMKQPKLVAQIFPIIFLTDWMKGRAVVYMTERIEELEKDTQQITAMRSKVEAFDIKNAELLQRAGAGATDFTRRRWEELTLQIQVKNIAKDLTARTKAFFAWIERNFVFSVLIDCALAHLISIGKLVSADIFVFSRAIEDAVDTVLMKSRSEAELARMMTQIDNLKEIASVWDNANKRNLINCNVPPDGRALSSSDGGDPDRSMIVIRNLLYSRGTAVVRIDHLELQAGIYALTGGNGSGKSTLFRVIMSCASNKRGIDLTPSISLSTPLEPFVEEDDVEREESCEASEEGDEEESVQVKEQPSPAAADPESHPRLSITMPSANVVEISQTFYWPLYSKPIDWILQGYITDTCDEGELQSRVRRVAEELDSLEFAQAPIDSEQNATSIDAASMAPSADVVSGIMEQLLEEKEDWFNDLSGGQRSKVELVRTVFLQDQCPGVLLVDETMAPLDPKSKALVMAKIKAFCAGSVVIVIYHTDVGREIDGEGGQTVECVPSNDFFDGNLHVENKVLHLRPVC